MRAPAKTMATGEVPNSATRMNAMTAMAMDSGSFRELFAIFQTDAKMSAVTAARTPASACWTGSRSAKFLSSAAISEMMTRLGDTTPRVARTAPGSPACFLPRNVAVLTAMTPGVH